MAEAILALVFDMDGTLIDSTVCETSAYRNAVLAAGGGDCSAEQIIASSPLGPPRMILRHLLGREATLEDERAYLAALHDYAYSVVVYEGIALCGRLHRRVTARPGGGTACRCRCHCSSLGTSL